jgi:hypothetical protein
MSWMIREWNLIMSGKTLTYVSLSRKAVLLDAEKYRQPHFLQKES